MHRGAGTEVSVFLTVCPGVLCCSAKFWTMLMTACPSMKHNLLQPAWDHFSWHSFHPNFQPSQAVPPHSGLKKNHSKQPCANKHTSFPSSNYSRTPQTNPTIKATKFFLLLTQLSIPQWLPSTRMKHHRVHCLQWLLVAISLLVPLMMGMWTVMADVWVTCTHGNGHSPKSKVSKKISFKRVPQNHTAVENSFAFNAGLISHCLCLILFRFV